MTTTDEKKPAAAAERVAVSREPGASAQLDPVRLADWRVAEAELRAARAESKLAQQVLGALLANPRIAAAKQAVGVSSRAEAMREADFDVLLDELSVELGIDVRAATVDPKTGKVEIPGGTTDEQTPATDEAPAAEQGAT